MESPLTIYSLIHSTVEINVNILYNEMSILYMPKEEILITKQKHFSFTGLTDRHGGKLRPSYIEY